MEEESIDGGGEQNLRRVLADRRRAVVLAPVDGDAALVAALRRVTVVTGLAIPGLHNPVAAVGAVGPAGDAGNRGRAGRVAGLSGIENSIAAGRRWDARGIRAGLRVDLGARRVHAEEAAARVVAHVDGALIVVCAVARVAHALVVYAAFVHRAGVGVRAVGVGIAATRRHGTVLAVGLRCTAVFRAGVAVVAVLLTAGLARALEAMVTDGAHVAVVAGGCVVQVLAETGRRVAGVVGAAVQIVTVLLWARRARAERADVVQRAGVPVVARRRVVDVRRSPVPGRRCRRCRGRRRCS